LVIITCWRRCIDLFQYLAENSRDEVVTAFFAEPRRVLTEQDLVEVVVVIGEHDGGGDNGIPRLETEHTLAEDFGEEGPVDLLEEGRGS